MLGQNEDIERSVQIVSLGIYTNVRATVYRSKTLVFQPASEKQRSSLTEQETTIHH